MNYSSFFLYHWKPRRGVYNKLLSLLLLFFLFHELQNSLLVYNARKICQLWWIEQDGISVIKSEAVPIHFLSDIFIAVAVVVA